MIRLSPRHSIRGRLLFLAIAVEALMLTILVFNSLRLQHGAMTSQARLQAQQYNPVLQAALTAPLAQRDFATVQAVVDESRTTGGVDYIVVVDRSGKRVGSSGWPDDRPLAEASRELPLFETNKVPRYDMVVPIVMHNQSLGTLHFGLNLSRIISARRALLIQGLAVAVVEIVLSSLIILLIGYWLTRHLEALTQASRLVAAGNPPPPVPEGNDDVGQLGAAFNTMSRIISERVNELTLAKDAAEASERAKSQSEERLKLALAGANLGLWDWDLSSGRVTYSQEWATMLGYDVEELEPSVRMWESLVHPDDMPLVQQTLQRHIAGDIPMYETEHRCRTKSGEWRWILDRGRVVEWAADGRSARAAGTHLDVTDRRQAEDELRRLNEELEQRVAEEVHNNREKDVLLLHQDKMSSIGRLAAGVAHEINNPLAFIASNLGTLNGYVETLTLFYTFLLGLVEKNCSGEELQMLQDATLKQDIMFILEDIGPLINESSEGADRVKRIVHDLKDFARMEDRSAELIDLNDCVRSTINIVRNEIKYVADLDLHLGEIPPVICSRHQISQVIVNLLVNAAHSIRNYGSIIVSTHLEPGHVVLKVCDTGHGMSEDVRKRVFDPFFTTKEVGEGTGLGLSISYSIVQKHGGEITVESREGEGSIFTVKLPLKDTTEFLT